MMELKRVCNCGKKLMALDNGAADCIAFSLSRTDIFVSFIMNGEIYGQRFLLECPLCGGHSTFIIGRKEK